MGMQNWRQRGKNWKIDSAQMALWGGGRGSAAADTLGPAPWSLRDCPATLRGASVVMRPHLSEPPCQEAEGPLAPKDLQTALAWPISLLGLTQFLWFQVPLFESSTCELGQPEGAKWNM